ncbi:MAG: pyruvate:ferredoxin (flavodoxin) oxidoreductase [Nanoarchaeota archaeon]
MDRKKYITCDGNTAASNIAYAFSEVAAIYPITPSSNMGEMADAWAAKGKKNIFGQPLKVIEMQSEGGASGSVHGALSAGALTTTYTASQGLLLMIPNMHKIAGEMLPTVFHVSARSLACQALSIFADHSDVMSVRNTGFAITAASNIQETQDMAIIAHLSTLTSRVPFLSFFDGFRTSHAIEKIEPVSYEILKEMLPENDVRKFREDSLNPQRPVNKVGAENPDVYFQGRETVNKYYDQTPYIVEKYMDLLYKKTQRRYNLFDYVGHPQADKIIIAMGTSVDTIEETINYLNSQGQKLGLIKVRLYRPFSVEHFIKAIPETVKKIAVLDRTKEPGSIGEPLYLDICAALKNKDIEIIGGRYGLSSKEFTPSQVKAVFDHLENKCTHNFTVGINDDVSHLSLPIDSYIETELPNTVRCKFWGYGSDGTVSANKNSIKIIGEKTDKFVQAYFSYDSKKSGGVTVSHLRFGDKPIKSQYLLTKSDFIALHKTSYIGRYDILEGIKDNGTFLINTSVPKEEVFNSLTKDMQETIINKKIKLYSIDATKIAKSAGLGNRINTVMQVAFFKLTDIIPFDSAVNYIKEFIEKQFSSKGQNIVDMNFKAVDLAISALEEIYVPQTIEKSADNIKLVPDNSNDWIKSVVEPIMRSKGDDIPVSKMPLNGAVPLGTTALEKREVGLEVPKWMSENCIQCGQCSLVCPHAAIRIKQIEPHNIEKAPQTFQSILSKTKNDKQLNYSVQVYPQDCVGCGVCVEACPAKEKALAMIPLEESKQNGEVENANYFNNLPEILDGTLDITIKGSQLKTPLFEFSGACAGCGETPYVKLATQLFGDRMIIANATGCSSIYGGTFPSIPFTINKYGQGPAWANSLFEDNAEYGFGFRLAIDQNRQQLKDNIKKLLETGTTNELRSALNKMLESWDDTSDNTQAIAREVVSLIPHALSCVYGESEPILKKIDELKDFLVDKSVWIIGGDGWAYDIGYGGLDHVMAQGKNVNVLVLDTEVYSNTGGQASKATPRAAIAKFAASGKEMPKKNLGMMMMSYGNVYVASIDIGANMAQVVRAFKEAESYDGPSIIIAYSPCIAHGFNMKNRLSQEKSASTSGYWPIYRYNPELVKAGKEPFIFESKEPTTDFADYIGKEIRYKALQVNFPQRAQELYALAQSDAKWRFDTYKKLAKKE